MFIAFHKNLYEISLGFVFISKGASKVKATQKIFQAPADIYILLE